MRKLIAEINEIAMVYFITMLVLINLINHLSVNEIEILTLINTILFAYVVPVSIITVLLSKVIKPKSIVLFKICFSILLFLLSSILVRLDPVLTFSKVIMYTGIIVYFSMATFSVLKK